MDSLGNMETGKNVDVVCLVSTLDKLDIMDCPTPSVVSSNNESDTDEDDVEEELSCAELYGPYPNAIPVPYISSDLMVPSEEIIRNAKVFWDLRGTSDYRDVGTPDEWIPRDGRLVRLTGRHPFNVEPPLSVHNQYKFITPSALHYVRNHGAVPDLKWEEHTVCVGGLVRKNLELSMDDLVTMKYRELPVTLVCAGNRRKEQNMIRQTIGFNWGPSGVSTNVWRGVPLRDLLLLAGVKDSYKHMTGKHVEFIGVEDLPNKVGPGPFPHDQWGKLVKYGTSIPLSRAMNPAYDVIIAYMANGELLQPDHGYPVRLIIPGYIGGRMIKWLKHINVIDHETTNHYHYHDNRIFPPHVTSDIAIRDGWWYRPEYIFNELNINSAISQPNHNTALVVRSGGEEEKKDDNDDNFYDIVGYAYTGGGRAITRVEVSTDMGINWEVATIDRKERQTPHGMYWCWIWWNYKVRLSDLSSSKEIWCRAWDEANNTQPINPTWTLMGMGNNHVFRVKIHSVINDVGHKVLKFEHPTQPGQETGGWMTTPEGKPESAGYGHIIAEEEEPIELKPSTAAKLISMQEVSKHNTLKDIWIIINNKVYDTTDYLDLHPGGVNSLLINGGADATEDFFAIHSSKANKMLEKFYVGDLDTSTIVASASLVEDRRDEKTGRLVALDPKKKRAFKLQVKTVLSSDSFLLDFALPTPDHILGLPTGQHIFLSGSVNGETVLRPYTPISSNHDVGHVQFVIKAYRPCEAFPKGGKFSQYLDSLKIGDSLEMRGPVGEFDYISKGKYFVHGQEHFSRCFNMVAGGTGITPVMQIAAEILRNAEDETRVSMIFACRTENDLLMRSTLDDWANMYPNRFKIHYVLSGTAPPEWKYSTGFVSKDMFESHLYAPADDVHTLLCGPPVMLDRACTPNLIALGHKETRLFYF